MSIARAMQEVDPTTRFGALSNDAPTRHSSLVIEAWGQEQQEP